jgi:hypothetical protein
VEEGGMTMTWEEYLRQKAPLLAGDDFNFQRDLYMANADAGVYDTLPALNVPVQPAADQTGWDFLDQKPDLDAYNRQILAENQPAAAAKPELSKWDKFGNAFKSVLPALLTAVAISKDETGRGGATALEAYNQAKQQQFENEMAERMYKQKQDEVAYSRSRQDQMDAWNKYTWQTDRNDRRDDSRLAADRWDREYGLKSEQNRNQKDQWEKEHELALKKLDADSALAQGKIDFDTWAKQKEFELTQDELKLKKDLGWGEIGVKRDAINQGLTPGGKAKTKPPTAKQISDSVYSDIYSNLGTYRTRQDAVAALKRQRSELLQYLSPQAYDQLLKKAEIELDEDFFGSKFVPAKSRGTKAGFVSYYLDKVKNQLGGK